MTQTNGGKTTAEAIIEVSLDFDSYTNGELEELEELLGGNLYALTERSKPLPHRVMIGLLWLTMRRRNPETTMDEVRAMKGSAWAVAKLPDPLPSSGAKSEPTASPLSAPSTT